MVVAVVVAAVVVVAYMDIVGMVTVDLVVFDYFVDLDSQVLVVEVEELKSKKSPEQIHLDKMMY